MPTGDRRGGGAGMVASGGQWRPAGPLPLPAGPAAATPCAPAGSGCQTPGSAAGFACAASPRRPAGPPAGPRSAPHWPAAPAPAAARRTAWPPAPGFSERPKSHRQWEVTGGWTGTPRTLQPSETQLGDLGQGGEACRGRAERPAASGVGMGAREPLSALCTRF